MIKTDKNIEDVLFVLNNLRKEDLLELKALFGEDWYTKTLKSVQNVDYMILLGKDDNANIVPIAVGGFSDLKQEKAKMACVWLISSVYIKFNKKLLFKAIQEQIKIASKQYQMLCNYIFTSNFEAKKWLQSMGFIFQEKNKDNFEFFYKITERGN